MRDATPQILDTGTRPVLIGHGPAEHLPDLRRDLDIPHELITVTDPERSAYRVAGWQRSAGSVFSIRALLAGGRAWSSGARISGLLGDPLQLGGVLVVNPDDSVTYQYPSRHAGDHPSIASLLAALIE